MYVREIDGLPVLDGKRTLVIHVTRRDIRGASPRDPSDCAVARACRRELDVLEARVHLSRTYLRTNDTNWLRYVTPKAIRDELIAFDRGGRFEPVETALRPIWPSEVQGTKRKSGPRKDAGKPRRTPYVVKNIRGAPI